MTVKSKITVDATQYDAAISRTLSNTEKKVAATNKKIKDSVREANAGINAAGGLGQFGWLGKLAAHFTPAALAAAALTAALKIGIEFYKKSVMSAEEYSRRLGVLAEKAAAARQELEKRHAAESSLIGRLKELDAAEFKSIDAKQEMAVLIGILTKKYGDLGISIDETTGKINNLAKAEAKMNERQFSRQKGAYVDELNATRRVYADSFKANRKKIFAKDVKAYTYYGNMAEYDKLEQEFYDKFNSRPLNEQISKLTVARDNTKNEADYKKYDDMIKQLEKIREIQAAIKTLEETGFISDEDARKAAEKATRDSEHEKSLKRQKATQEEINKLKAENQNAEAAAGYDALDENDKISFNRDRLKALDDEKGGIGELKADLLSIDQSGLDDLQKAEIQEQILRYDKEIYETDKKRLAIQKELDGLLDKQRKFRESLTGRYASLDYEASKRLGGDRLQLEKDEALRQARKSKGAELSEAEIGAVEQLVTLGHRLDNLQTLNLSGLDIKTNALTARGGFAGGAVSPDADRVAKAIAADARRQVELLREIKTEITKGGVI